MKMELLWPEMIEAFLGRLDDMKVEPLPFPRIDELSLLLISIFGLKVYSGRSRGYYGLSPVDIDDI